MGYEWFKMHSKGWLTGSIRAQLTMEERSVWADLLAFANESRVRGIICRAVGIPFTREYIANYFSVPLEILNSTIEKCQDDRNMEDDLHRIEIDPDGCIVITNWEHYQAVPPEKARLDARGKELVARTQARQSAVRFPDEVIDALPEKSKRELREGK